jgi:hypothetical protein
MRITPVALLFALLGVGSARIGESVNASDQDETRKLEERESIEIDYNDNVRVMVGYKNDQGKLKAIATEASELITEFKTVNVLTMTIPRMLLDILDNDPDIK